MPSVISHKFVVVTNCTGRKRGGSTGFAFVKPVLSDGLDELTRTWVSALRDRPTLCASADLYSGRGFSEARRTADELAAPLSIVSAGLGLIGSQDQVPPYDLTVGPGANSVVEHLRRRRKSVADWWSSLNSAWNRPQPFARLLAANPTAVVLIALPSTYLAMVQDELSSLAPEERERLRIFTSEFGSSTLPASLAPQVMPYDERLESSEYSGTRNDFPQRALRHFVASLKAHTLTVNESKNSVKASLLNLKLRVVPTRERRTDDEIVSLLKANWKAHKGLGGRLLRFLRDDAGVACEQSRFRDLWRQVRIDLENDT